MDKNKLLFCFGAMGVAALATVALTGGMVFQTRLSALAGTGPEAYQIVLDQTNKNGSGGGNQGNEDYNYVRLTTTTTSGSPFETKLYLYKNGYMTGSFDPTGNYIYRATFTSGDIYLKLDFTLKGILMPSSVVIDGQFSNSQASTPWPDETQFIFTGFTDNGDGSFDFHADTKDALYRTIQVDKITINYSCY